jgi:uncharacterized coiled-coil protein SlyX|tara:strand:- start:471 stop:788 length:318 start_codon:yes stop_codon:yes gene_type:complete
MSENNGARSYKGEVIGDSMAITINFKWLLQILAFVGMLVYSYWQIETRIRDLENKIVIADENIGDLLSKHIVEERVEREELAEKVAFYEKEFNINPLSWGKRKKK